MNAFGADNVAHNLPLLFISGLEPARDTPESSQERRTQDGGFRVKTDLPLLSTNLATTVRDAILGHDGTAAAWGPAPNSAKMFSIRDVGRVGSL
jgi:hypothetical protein